MPAAELKSTRDKLLDAARVLFLERGYEGVSIRDITEVAGANVASINYHFGSKEDFYREVFRGMLLGSVSEMLRKLNEIVEEESPPDLNKVIRTYVEGFLGEFLTSRDAQNFVRLVSDEMSEQGLATDILVKEAAVPLHKVLKRAILAARPDIPPIKASLIIASVFGQMFHFVRARHIIHQTMDREYDPIFIREIIDHIMDFSIKGMGRESRNISEAED